MDKASREHLSPSPSGEDRGQSCRRQFKGIRMRKWGSWVSEIRIPKTREKIWLGSYKTAEQAARAYDAGIYCVRGPNAKFNFPNSVPAIPSASSLSRQQIQVAAAKYALDEIPSILPSLQNITNIKTKISKAQDLGLWETPFDDNGGLNLDKIPSIEEALVWEFIPSWEEEQQAEYVFFDPTDLWNFGDI
eukprot:PITA_28332